MAVTVPSNAIPATIRTVATSLPGRVVGYSSPYPTVVMVVTAHHIASPKAVMLASWLRRSASSTANAAQNASSDDPPMT